MATKKKSPMKKSSDKSTKTSPEVTTLTVRPLPVPAPPKLGMIAAKIKSDDEAVLVNEALKERRAILDKIDEGYEEVAGHLSKAVRALQLQRRTAAAPIQAEADALGAALAAWDVEKTKRLVAKAEKEAVKLEQKGDADAAQLLRVQAADAPSTALEGTTFVDRWVAVVADEKLVPSYFNGVELRAIKQGPLNDLARLTKETPGPIPGVKFENQRAAREKS